VAQASGLAQGRLPAWVHFRAVDSGRGSSLGDESTGALIPEESDACRLVPDGALR
jgi:hypothetical protein